MLPLSNLKVKIASKAILTNKLQNVFIYDSSEVNFGPPKEDISQISYFINLNTIF